jgi:hypothetical protein
MTSISTPQRARDSTVRVIRLILVATLVVGLIGTVIELYLLAHTEDRWQRVPIFMILAALIVLIWHAAARTAVTVRAFQLTMVLFIVAGVTGIFLHYQGNAVFELEMEPGLVGWKLFRSAMLGATPALAPGSMIQFGLIGLAYTYRHPWLHRAAGDQPST